VYWEVIVITRCCKLCLYIGLCVRALNVGMRGRRKICHILRLYYYWLVCVQKDVQWQNAFTSNLKQPKGNFFGIKRAFFACIKTSTPPISIPSVIMRRKSPFASFHQRHREIQFSSFFMLLFVGNFKLGIKSCRPFGRVGIYIYKEVSGSLIPVNVFGTFCSRCLLMRQHQTT
jgi:hypothetical protein